MSKIMLKWVYGPKWHRVCTIITDHMEKWIKCTINHFSPVDSTDVSVWEKKIEYIDHIYFPCNLLKVHSTFDSCTCFLCSTNDHDPAAYFTITNCLIVCIYQVASLFRLFTAVIEMCLKMTVWWVGKKYLNLKVQRLRLSSILRFPIKKAEKILPLVFNHMCRIKRMF